MSDTIADKGKPSFKLGTGIILLGAVTTSALGICAVTASFILPAFRKVCLPFVPATNCQVKNVIKALHFPSRHGMTVVDIGSGDGRIVFASASHGFHSTGYELNIWLVLFSKYQSWVNGLRRSAHFQRQDLWKADYSKFDNVVIFGVEEMMPSLETKLLKELSDGSRIVACRFPLPTTSPTCTVGSGVDTVWSYTVKRK